MFRLFTARIKAMFDKSNDYLIIRQQMFRLFTARNKAMFDNYVILY